MKVNRTVGDTGINWLFTEIKRVINAGKDVLPRKCYDTREPYLVVVRPVPLPPCCDPREHHKEDKRKLNKAVDRVKKRHDNVHTINIDAILPTDDICFATNKDLSAYGYKIFWNDLNLALERWDESEKSHRWNNLNRFRNNNRRCFNNQKFNN